MREVLSLRSIARGTGLTVGTASIVLYAVGVSVQLRRKVRSHTVAYQLVVATDTTDVWCFGQANHHMQAVEAMQAQEQLLRAELEGKQRHLVSVQAELARARGLRLAVAQAIQERVRQRFPDHR